PDLNSFRLPVALPIICRAWRHCRATRHECRRQIVGSPQTGGWTEGAGPCLAPVCEWRSADEGREQTMRLIGVDVGGTFTDLVYADTDAGQTGVHKISTTPDDPSRGVVAGLAALCDKYNIPRETIDVVFHGTTIATNSILEHDGAVTGMITSGGSTTRSCRTSPGRIGRW